MTRVSKSKDIQRLQEIAVLTDKKTGIYTERRRIWKRRLDAKDSSQAELARASGVMRADIIRGVKHGEKSPKST